MVQVVFFGNCSIYVQRIKYILVTSHCQDPQVQQDPEEAGGERVWKDSEGSGKEGLRGISEKIRPKAALLNGTVTKKALVICS